MSEEEISSEGLSDVFVSEEGSTDGSFEVVGVSEEVSLEEVTWLEKAEGPQAERERTIAERVKILRTCFTSTSIYA